MSKPFLIDTHVLIWYHQGDPRLSMKIVAILDHPHSICYLSKASLWGMVIKSSLGKLQLGVSLPELEDFLTERNIRPLDFNFTDLNVLHSLPYHHHDPFDRLIIAQALANDLPVISDDAKFGLYPVDLIAP